ncbi:MAG: acetate--CoA ligase family protein [Candidatus Aenigmatarchaeota archaeon]
MALLGGLLKGKKAPAAARKAAHNPKPHRKARPVPKKPAAKPKPKVRPAEKAPPKPVLVEKMAEDRAYDLLREAKIPVARTVYCRTEKRLEEAVKKVGFPAVMKVSGTKIMHRTELGGIINVNTPEEAEAAFAKLMKIRNAEGVLMQKKMTGFEVIVASKADERFGYVVSAGMGGIYAELLKDVVFRVCPVDIATADAMIKELKGYEILNGARGAKPINFAALYDLISKVSRFMISHKFKEMDLNPVFCNEDGCFVADVKIIK